MRDFIEEHVTIICAIIIITVTIIIGCFIVKANNEVWNDGKCKCGGNWEYKDSVSIVVGHKPVITHVRYIYECDNCHKVIKQEILR